MIIEGQISVKSSQGKRKKTKKNRLMNNEH